MMIREMFTPEEEKTFRELCAKQKRIKRAERADESFLANADERKDELLARWGMSGNTGYWDDIRNAYGCFDDEKLYRFLVRDKAISIFREREERNNGSQEGTPLA